MKHYLLIHFSFYLFVLNIFVVFQTDQEARFENSIGMEMIHIESGEFQMGNDGEIDYSVLVPDAKYAPYRGKGAEHPYLENGLSMESHSLEWDEGPSHLVNISRSFYIASAPVTNAQYEQFDPYHADLRGKRGFSSGDNDAVVFVSWKEATAFTEWLSKKEGKPYRLPTEAEWEYAARAGTTTPYYTGNTLPEEYHHHQVMNRTHTIDPENVNLEVGQTPANPWGLHDIHGLVEEWCYDWYGPYTAGKKTDPVGREYGIARVTRGGSHSTGLPFLRSANRSGAFPNTGHYLIGFRVVMGEMPDTEPLPEPEPARWAQNVSQQRFDWSLSNVPEEEPVFKEPRTFVQIPEDANGPLYITHNHNPALTALPNGDLLAIWFTTVKERGREMLVAGSRLRQGQDQWDEADVFFNVPDRNQTGQALWWDGENTIYHFSGVGVGDHWRDLSVVMRTSTDNGVTWDTPEIIGPEYGPRHQPFDSVIKTADGKIIFAADAGPSGNGGSVIHISSDGGKTWRDPGAGMPPPEFVEGGRGAWIAGIHAPFAELKDGRLLAFGRGDEIEGRMPKSISSDGGDTWTYSASNFDPIGGAQRSALIRLSEGPLLFVSFAKSTESFDELGDRIENTKGSLDLAGSGMFAALSYDEGDTWPVQKLVTPGDKKRVLNAPPNHRWGEKFSILDKDQAESRGYLTATQTADGMIHVLSSGTHYTFNLTWVQTP